MTEPQTIHELAKWLTRVCTSENPPNSVVAYNVGLFETSDGYTAYLAGAKRFDGIDGDWACDEAFTPAERYCPISAEGFSDWHGVHIAAVKTLRDFLLSPSGKSSFLANAKALTVGFDDGDLERLK